MRAIKIVTFPPELAALVVGVAWAQVTLGESGAQVYRLRAGAETRYLKVEPHRPHGELHAEAARLRWLQGRLPVPALRYADDFDEERAGRSPASLLDELHATRPPDEDLVLTHGDYCFPNVVINDWSLSGFIDLGRCGVADRYHDLAQAERSVRRNLGERWVAPFFATYGISTPDEAKLQYYQLLDELF